MHSFRNGDKVTVDSPSHGGVWTVVSTTGPVNAVLAPEGGGRRLRAPYSMLAPFDPAHPVTVTKIPVPEFFVAGEFVRIAAGKFAGVYVVLADKGDKVNVALLGGDGGRYIRAMKRSLQRLDASAVLRDGVL